MSVNELFMDEEMRARATEEFPNLKKLEITEVIMLFVRIFASVLT